MKRIFGSRNDRYLARLNIFLVVVALIAAMVACDGDDLECQLTITSTVGGNVSEPGEGTFTYNRGTAVYLVAESEPGYGFSRWTGAFSSIADVTAAVTTIIMNGDYSITADFGEVVEIRNWSDLDAIRDSPGGFYLLMNDLDFTSANYTVVAGPAANGGKGWQPIGALNYTFTGTFDGQGYEIRDLFINRPDDDLVGLFGGVGLVIRDIGVVNASVTGNWGVAGLVGENLGIVSHCYFTGNVTGLDDAGGLVGHNYGIVSNSRSAGSVTSTEGSAGGLVESNEGNVRTSYSASSVTGNSPVGGLVGADWYGGVTTSYSTGNVVGLELVGGLIGIIQGSHVTDCYSTGSVTGQEDVGGLLGRRWETIVSHSFWDMDTSGQATSAGGSGKTTSEMQDIATFPSWNIVAVGLNETNPAYIWNIVDGMTYPFLSWQLI
jgi:Divergent InlB B-repeat domain/The GLUG motif